MSAFNIGKNVTVPARFIQDPPESRGCSISHCHKFKEEIVRGVPYRCKSYIPHPDSMMIDVQEVEYCGYRFKAEYQFLDGQKFFVYMMIDPRIANKPKKRSRPKNPMAKRLEEESKALEVRKTRTQNEGSEFKKPRLKLSKPIVLNRQGK